MHLVRSIHVTHSTFLPLSSLEGIFCNWSWNKGKFCSFGVVIVSYQQIKFRYSPTEKREEISPFLVYGFTHRGHILKPIFQIRSKRWNIIRTYIWLNAVKSVLGKYWSNLALAFVFNFNYYHYHYHHHHLYYYYYYYYYYETVLTQCLLIIFRAETKPWSWGAKG